MSTMKSLFGVVVFYLCHQEASAAGLCVLDQGSLLQKSTKLEDAAKLADGARGSLLLPLVANQVPGMEDMLASANMTMQDVMGIAQQVLLSLKEPNFVDLVNSTLKEAMALADDWIKAALIRITELKVDGQNLTGEEDSYELLTGFYKKEKKMAMGLADALLDKLTALKDGVPKNLTAAIEDLNLPLNGTDGLADMVRTGLGGLFDGVANSTNITLCKALRPAIEKTKTADKMLNDQMLPMFAQVRTMLPSIGPMVGMMVPEVANIVTDLANATLEGAEPLLTSFAEAFHSEVQIVTQIGTVYSKCSLGSGSVRSGPGLLLFAVALAAWASLWA